MVPLKKRAIPSSATDFRPIALLCFLSKVLEKLVHDQMYEYLTSQNLLDSHQTGFRPRSSTQTALLKLTDDIRTGVDKKLITILLQFDFSKAFDTVSPTRLLEAETEGFLQSCAHVAKILSNMLALWPLHGPSHSYSLFLAITRSVSLHPAIFHYFRPSHGPSHSLPLFLAIYGHHTPLPLPRTITWSLTLILALSRYLWPSHGPSRSLALSLDTSRSFSLFLALSRFPRSFSLSLAIHGSSCCLSLSLGPSRLFSLFLAISQHPRPLSLSPTITRSLPLHHAITRSLSLHRAITQTFRSHTLLVNPSRSLSLLHGLSSSLAITRSLSLLRLFLAIYGHRTVPLTPTHSSYLWPSHGPSRSPSRLPGRSRSFSVALALSHHYSVLHAHPCNL